MSKKRDRKEWLWRIAFALLYIVVGALCYRLYLRQAIYYEGPLGTYRSDLPPHIAGGVKGTGYSLLEMLYRVLLVTLGLNEKSVAAVLSACTVGCVLAGYVFMKRTVEEADPHILHLLSFACLFVFAIYVPALNPHRYLGLQHASNWHNDTYTGMRFAGMLALLYYLRYQKRYVTDFHLRQFVVFTLLLAVTNLVKPNFIFAFAPVMALYLLADCVRDRGRTILKQILFGLPVLLSLLALFFQLPRLFDGSEVQAVSSGHMFGVSFAYYLRLRAANPVASLLQSAAFPLLVLLFNLRHLRRDRCLSTGWLIYAVGLAEYIFIHEEGERKDHGNISWGYSFCLYLVFLLSSAYYIRNVTEDVRAVRSGAFRSWSARKKAGHGIYLTVAALFFLLHLISGLTYFSLAMQGSSLWI